MNDNVGYDFKTYTNMAIITANNLILIIASVIIAVLGTNLFIIACYIAELRINLYTTIYGVIIFLASFFSCMVIKKEFMLQLNKDMDMRPPLSATILLVTAFGLIYFAFPQTITKMPRSSLSILTVILVISISSSVTLQRLYFVIFTLLVNLMTRLNRRQVLEEPAFLEKAAAKTEESKRYGTPFSLILLTFTIPENAEARIRRGLIHPIFLNIIKHNVRGSDTVGMIQKGSIAAILSNYNTEEKAKLHANRLIDILKGNEVLDRKLKVYKSHYRCSICTYTEAIENGDTITKKAIDALKEAIKAEEEIVIAADK